VDQLAPRIEAIIDDACRVQSSLESEGRPAGVALEHAFNRTSSWRRALVKEYSDGASHPRLVWHALTALTRIEGNGTG